MRHVGLLDVAQPPGVGSDGRLEGVARVAAVAEGRIPGHVLEHLPESRLDRVVDVVVRITGQLLEDPHQLVVGVVGELDRRAEAARQTRVLGDEDLHREGIAGDDDHEVVALVLHLLDQGVDGLGAVLVTRQAVGLVDEQDPTLRRLHHLGRLHRGLPEVAGNQLTAVDLHELTLGEQAEGAIDAADEPGDGRLARARVPDEDEVPGDRRGLEPGLLALGLDLEQGHLPVDLGLDRAQADEAVEVGEQLFQALRLGLGLGGLLGLGVRIRSNGHGVALFFGRVRVATGALGGVHREAARSHGVPVAEVETGHRWRLGAGRRDLTQARTHRLELTHDLGPQTSDRLSHGFLHGGRRGRTGGSGRRGQPRPVGLWRRGRGWT